MVGDPDAVVVGRDARPFHAAAVADGGRGSCGKLTSSALHALGDGGSGRPGRGWRGVPDRARASRGGLWTVEEDWIGVQADTGRKLRA